MKINETVLLEEIEASSPSTKLLVQIANEINKLRGSLARVLRRKIGDKNIYDGISTEEFHQLVEILRALDKW